MPINVIEIHHHGIRIEGDAAGLAAAAAQPSEVTEIGQRWPRLVNVLRYCCATSGEEDRRRCPRPDSVCRRRYRRR